MAHTGRVLGFEYGAANCEVQGRELLGLSGVPEGELEAVSAETAMAHTGRVLGFEDGADNCEAQGRELLGLSGVPEGVELEAACSLEPSVRREERVAVPRVIASSAAFLRIASTASSRSSRLPVHVARSLATRVEWYLHGCRINELNSKYARTCIRIASACAPQQPRLPSRTYPQTPPPPPLPPLPPRMHCRSFPTD